MATINSIYRLAEDKAAKSRSAWERGVGEYAVELLDSFDCDGDGDKQVEITMELLLNGASDWKAYSYGGCSLIYDGDIAERVCCPSELKRSKNGERKPSANEEWLDVQARALYHAALFLIRAAR